MEQNMKMHKTRRNVQIVSIAMLLTTICPYLYLFLNIEPVYSYGQQTGGNALLQIYIPLCLIGILGFGSFVLLLISLVAKEKN